MSTQVRIKQYGTGKGNKKGDQVPYLFSYGGKAYCIPPKGMGGTWVGVNKSFIERGRTLTKVVPEKRSDLPKRDWISIPSDAKKHLSTGAETARQQALGIKLEFIDDLELEIDARERELKEQEERLSADRAALEARISKLEAELKKD